MKKVRSARENDRKARHGINYEVSDSRERRLFLAGAGSRVSRVQKGPGLLSLPQIDIAVKRAQLELRPSTVDGAVD